MEILLPFLPFIAVGLLLVLRASGLVAALAGIVVTLLITGFAGTLTGDTASSIVSSLGVPALEVVFILLGGVVFSQLLSKTGGQEYISDLILKVSGSKRRAVLFICLAVSPFLESAIGFSVGIFIVVPLLLTLGYSATKAVMLSFFGLFLTPWGSLGPGLLITVQLGGVGLTELGFWTAIYSIPAIVLLIGVVLLTAFDRNDLKQVWLETVTTTAVIIVVLIVSNLWLSVPPSGVLASAAAAVTLILFNRGAGRIAITPDRQLLLFLAPYVVLVVGITVTSMISRFVIPLHIAFTSPAVWLNISVLTALLTLRPGKSDTALLLKESLVAWLNPAATMTSYILLGGLITTTGLSADFARYAAEAGLWNLLIIPAISTMAGYISASNSVLGAMFNSGTASIAQSIGMSTVHAMAIQTAAGSVGTIIAPSRIAVALAALKSHSRPGVEQLDHGRVLRTGFTVFGIMILVSSAVGFLSLIQ